MSHEHRVPLGMGNSALRGCPDCFQQTTPPPCHPTCPYFHHPDVRRCWLRLEPQELAGRAEERKGLGRRRQAAARRGCATRRLTGTAKDGNAAKAHDRIKIKACHVDFASFYCISNSIRAFVWKIDWNLFSFFTTCAHRNGASVSPNTKNTYHVHFWPRNSQSCMCIFYCVNHIHVPFLDQNILTSRLQNKSAPQT